MFDLPKYLFSRIVNADNTKTVGIETDSEGVDRLAVDTHSSDSPHKGHFLSEFLRNGGSLDMNVNGAITPVVFAVGPPAGEVWYISKMEGYMIDGSMSWSKFGSLAELSNGITIDYDEYTVKEDLLDGEVITTNGGWLHFTYNTEIESSSTDLLKIEWLFSQSGTFLRMDGDSGDTFNLTINDNLSGIDIFRCNIQGFGVINA